MEKNLRYSALLSIYGGLLTEKQLDTMEYYYDEDLSLGEIAENTGISRQGVRDFIKRGEESLDAFEEKLGLYRKLEIVSRIESCAEKIKEINLGAWNNRNIALMADEIVNCVAEFRNDM